MNPAEKFVIFAAECEHMAKFTHTPENKALWKRMAERWLRCAELFTQESLTAGTNARRKQPRTATLKWAYH